MNKQVVDFFNVDFSDLKMPVIVIFFDPIDVPDQYVARIFDLDKPTDTMTIRDTLEEIRATMPPRFAAKLLRHQEDHVSVVEYWI
jgi:hypothetical protein